jgi:stage III sporulation protein AA
MMQMNCAWQELLSFLPTSLRYEVDIAGKETMQELRLRAGQTAELICGTKHMRVPAKVSQQDLQFVLNIASKYSPWLSETLTRGYLTAPGGHRIGVCGEVVIKDGRITGIRNATSLCIRVARDFHGLANDYNLLNGSVLIIGQPGSGKTTFLRDLIRNRSERSQECVAVVDERCEIFPHMANFETGHRTDVMSGCSKKEGIEMMLRTMGPDTIAVDEITSESDCKGLLHAAWCGVSLIATAHAGSKCDLFNRPVYKPLIKAGIFDWLVILRKDKSWFAERIDDA